MALEKLEIETYFGQCKCCLSYGYLKTMWEQHVVDEKAETYGLMLTQCFSIEWTDDKSKNDDKICEECIWKLREAYSFKKQVLWCQNQVEQFEDNVEIKSDADNESFDEEYLDEEMLDDSVRSDDESSSHTIHSEGQSHIGRVSQDNDQYDNSEGEATIKDLDDDETQDYESNEDDDDFVPDPPATRKRKEAQEDDSNSGTDAPKSKWPKKLPLEQRYKTYKQYSEDALKDAFEAVIAKKMSQKLAAVKYRVPKKTLSAKVQAFKKNQEVFPVSKSRRFLSEVKSLLTYLNVTPFRSRANQSACFYCAGGPSNTFLSPDELRQHTRDAHSDFANTLEAAMRPSSSNTIVKLDVTDLACKTCHIPLPEWTAALDHLKFHNVELKCDKQLIPYTLDDKSCVLCRKQFSAYMLLDAHMNMHYPNHVCKLCGETFLSNLRLHTHEKIHQVGRYPCLVCDKVFPLDKYMKKHVLLSHSNALTVKCNYCTEVFKSEYYRQAHILSCHKERADSITCEICGKLFQWARLYKKHMTRAHGTRHTCYHCGKFLASRESLIQHMLKHKGLKEFNYPVCNKKYDSQASLQNHCKYMHKNVLIRFVKK